MDLVQRTDGAFHPFGARRASSVTLALLLALCVQPASAQDEGAAPPGGTQQVPAEAESADVGAPQGTTAATPAVAASEDAAVPAPQPAATAVSDTTVAEQEASTEQVERAAEEAADNSQRECTAQDVLRGLCTAEQAAASSQQKFWRIMARIDYQQPIVLDRDAENDIGMFYYLGGEIDIPLLTGLYASAWGGVQQRFWTVEGESEFDWIDPFVAVGIRTGVPLRDLGLPDHSLIMVHRLAAFFPASRESRANLYYTALDWVSAFRLPVLAGFMVGLDLRARYTFHEYAEQNGAAIPPEVEGAAGMNTRLRLEGGVLLQQQIFDDREFGNLIVQGSTGIRGLLRYSSRDDFESPESSQNLWEPDWYWSLGVTYTPIQYLSVTLSLDHGYSDLIRGGVAHTVGFDRDETKLTLSLFGRY